MRFGMRPFDPTPAGRDRLAGDTGVVTRSVDGIQTGRRRPRSSARGERSVRRRSRKGPIGSPPTGARDDDPIEPVLDGILDDLTYRLIRFHHASIPWSRSGAVRTAHPAGPVRIRGSRRDPAAPLGADRTPTRRPSGRRTTCSAVIALRGPHRTRSSAASARGESSVGTGRSSIMRSYRP
jgi:hypothetical protein